ncbi:MAG TPA: hypothetical protein VF913_11190 [Xanthobacteraceae bacterium]
MRDPGSIPPFGESDSDDVTVVPSSVEFYRVKRFVRACDALWPGARITIRPSTEIGKVSR